VWVHTMSALSAGLELGVVLDGKQHVIQSGNRRSRRKVGGLFISVLNDRDVYSMFGDR